ncbi:MAG TPA: hypothetical protein VFO25_05350 [Candidatus Eremiobacteraceae bacterium]|nr:hypothetical protein [Candidatus Eremiobacteraceae bacterium]
MHRTLTLVVSALSALALSACTASSVSAPPASSPGMGGAAAAQSGAPRALSSYEMLIRDAHGQMQRAHIFLPRGAVAPQASGGNLRYGGGSIQATPKIFVVYWQFPRYGDPSGEQAQLHSFYSGIGGSSWLNTDTQYYGPVGTFISNPTGQLAGEWVDTTHNIPRRLTTSSIATEALNAVAHFGYNFNAAYVVATPHGHNTSGFGSQFCAWHSAESSSSGEVAFTNMPYITDAGASCGANFNGLGPKAGITIVSGHEEAETQTDPVPSSGWVDSSGAEIGDKCAWISSGQGASQNITLSTGTFAVQSLWDNAFSGGSGGCVISGP